MDRSAQYLLALGLGAGAVYILMKSVEAGQLLVCQPNTAIIETCQDGSIAIKQRCIDNDWRATGDACCAPGDTITAKCPDGTTITKQTCQNYHMVDTGETCSPVPPPEVVCNDGEVVQETCLDGSTIITQECYGNTWWPTGRTCPAPQCQTGTQVFSKCSDGSDKLLRECVNGLWVFRGYDSCCPRTNTWDVGVIIEDNGDITDGDIDLMNSLLSGWQPYFEQSTRGLGHVRFPKPIIVGRPPASDDNLNTYIDDVLSGAGFTRNDFNIVIITSKGPSIWTGQDPYYWTDYYYSYINRPYTGISPQRGTFGDYRLLGVIMAETLLSKPFNASSVLTHEMGHTWMHYWNYAEGGVVKSDNLVLNSHLSPFVRAVDRNGENIDMMQSDTGPTLVDEAQGIWKIGGPYLTPLPPEEEWNLDLYLMGLIPKEQVHPIHMVVKTADYPGQFGWFYGYEKIITIDQIIEACGDWCEV